MQPVSKRPGKRFDATQPHTRLDLGRILQARQEISQVFRDSPQFECPALGNLLSCELIIKLETANPIGCFKGRATEVLMSRLARSQCAQAAVCASAGNLGQALAYSGRARGIAVTVIAGTSANAAKIDRIRHLGAPASLVRRKLSPRLAVPFNRHFPYPFANIAGCQYAVNLDCKINA